MAEGVGAGKMILLLDNYSLKSRLLHESLQKVDSEVLAIVLTEDNFLPDNVLSVYDLLIGNYKNNVIRKDGSPKFFNEIPIPDNWSFQAGVQVGDEKSGSIVYQHVEKGKIHYLDGSKKWLVREVEWYDRIGAVCFRDHYNRYGDICARTVYTSTGEPASKTWFSPEGREIIIENCVTHDIILNDEKSILFFRTRQELILYFLKKMGFQKHRILINSLASPFMLMFKLDASNKENTLFWHEIAENDIPWNMKLILGGQTGCCHKIVVQTREAYNRLLELGMPEDRVQKLGFIYSYEKENQHCPDALICTNSDRIEHCEALIKMLPQMHFHIAALTVMSQTLLVLEQYDNVSLYPAADRTVLDGLFHKCDYYFDINHYDEIVSAVYRAFVHDQLIISFQETIHNREYVADVHTYSVAEFERMVLDVQEIMGDRKVMKEHLEKQHRWALAESIDVYTEVLGI